MAIPKSQTWSEDLRNVWNALAQLKADVLVLRTMIHSRRPRVRTGKLQLRRGRKLGSSGRFFPSVQPTSRSVGSQTLFDPAAAEPHYQALGRWKGPLATASVQDGAREFWRTVGPEGTRWLIRRLRSETHIDSLHAAACTLAEMGAVAIPTILKELDQAPAPDQALALLKALGWMANDRPNFDQPPDPAVRIVARLLQARDSDTREAAAQALQVVAPDYAAGWLEARLDVETNEEVIATIQDVLMRARRTGA